mmetsp:Transcript_24624/g.52238  ORF Transcript_24624/g.52238 Transcript_24624/m.52238 type:complete len:209 (-) Transcript_24624:116-742(-)
MHVDGPAHVHRRTLHRYGGIVRTSLRGVYFHAPRAIRDCSLHQHHPVLSHVSVDEQVSTHGPDVVGDGFERHGPPSFREVGHEAQSHVRTDVQHNVRCFVIVRTVEVRVVPVSAKLGRNAGSAMRFDGGGIPRGRSQIAGVGKDVLPSGIGAGSCHDASIGQEGKSMRGIGVGVRRGGEGLLGIAVVCACRCDGMLPRASIRGNRRYG